MDKKMHEALQLLGGRAVIKDGESYYILMTLNEFKKIRQESTQGLTKQELVDKINSDIVSWKTSQEEDKIENINLEDIENEQNEGEVHYEKTI